VRGDRQNDDACAATEHQAGISVGPAADVRFVHGRALRSGIA
jgi:hypothetical protein